MEITINLPYGDDRLALTGTAEKNLKTIRDRLGVNIWARNGTLRISGHDRAVEQASYVIERLADAAKRHKPMDQKQLLDTIFMAEHRGNGRMRFDPDMMSSESGSDREVGEGGQLHLNGRRIKALTPAQEQYLEAIRKHDLTVCVGPAGTGKTYLAVAAAVDMLRRGQVRKLVLVRPAVEAGEKLGFLPGTMQDKVNPYLRPLLDALHEMMDFEHIQRFMACDLIEIVPLAFMRGRTLNDALIILDEAQNTTRSQMLMFLTRLGRGGKMVVTGDTSQIDLDDPTESGLVDAVRRVRRIKGVATITLTHSDIVRHELVQRIVEAYGRDKRGYGYNEAAYDEGEAEQPAVDAQQMLRDGDMQGYNQQDHEVQPVVPTPSD